MDNEKLEMKLLDYIDGNLTHDERIEVEHLLHDDAAARQLLEQLMEVTQALNNVKEIAPASRLRKRFDDVLAEQSLLKNKTKVVFFQPLHYKIAAAVALLIVGAWIGFWISRNNSQQQELAEIKKEMEATKLMMMSLIDNKQSASQRIEGVNVSLTIKAADDDVVRALEKRMNEDPNTNVRLAALDALSRFRHEAHVRKILLDALHRQKDPVVQIALIQLLVEMKEKRVIEDLQKIVDEEETMKAVKDEAYSGILKLS